MNDTIEPKILADVSSLMPLRCVQLVSSGGGWVGGLRMGGRKANVLSMLIGKLLAFAASCTSFSNAAMTSVKGPVIVKSSIIACP